MYCAHVICRGATIGVFIGCALLGFALFRYQLYRVRHRPEDLDEVQEALLGMGTMQSVDKAHIGFTLQFNRRRLSFDALNEEQASRVEEAVLQTVRSLDGLPRGLVTLLNGDDVTVRLAPDQPCALLVLPRPKKLRDGKVERYAHALMTAALTGGLRYVALSRT